MRRAFLFASIVGVLIARADACDYCLCSSGFSPLLTNTWSVRVDMRSLDLSTLVRDGVTQPNATDYSETYRSLQLSLIVPLWNGDASMLFALPVSSRAAQGQSIEDPATHVSMRNTGLGDALVMMRYRLLELMHEDWALALGVAAGVKAPTGATGATYPDGSYLDAHLQTGTGSWDPLVGANAFLTVGDWGASLNVLTAFPTAGARGYRFGTAANYDATMSYNVLYSTATRPGIFATLGLAGESTAMESTDGVKDENTGGTTLWVVPGARVDIGDLMIDGGVHVPVVRALNGVQYGATLRATLGAQYHF